MAPLDEAGAPAVNVAELLATGVQDITKHMAADGFTVNQVLRKILETMRRCACRPAAFRTCLPRCA